MMKAAVFPGLRGTAPVRLLVRLSSALRILKEDPRFARGGAGEQDDRPSAEAELRATWGRWFRVGEFLDSRIAHFFSQRGS